MSTESLLVDCSVNRIGKYICKDVDFYNPLGFLAGFEQINYLIFIMNQQKHHHKKEEEEAMASVCIKCFCAVCTNKAINAGDRNWLFWLLKKISWGQTLLLLLLACTRLVVQNKTTSSTQIYIQNERSYKSAFLIFNWHIQQSSRSTLFSLLIRAEVPSSSKF